MRVHVVDDSPNFNVDVKFCDQYSGMTDIAFIVEAVKKKFPL